MNARLWLTVFGLLAAACSSSAPAATPAGDDDDDAGKTATTNKPKTDQEIKAALADAGFTLPAPRAGGTLSMRPRALFSGYDGTHHYTMPFGVDGKAGSDLTVTLDDPSGGDIAPATLDNPGAGNDTKYFLLTTKKVGKFTITASSQGKVGTVELTVSAYTDASWSIGSQRYTSAGVTGDPPCASCHAGANGIDHSPTALASASDIDVGGVFVSGIDITGLPIHAGGDKQHRWDLTPEQRAGVVTYIRSLDPRGFTKN